MMKSMKSMVTIVKGNFENMTYDSPIRNPASNEKTNSLILSADPSEGKAILPERKKKKPVTKKIAKTIAGKEALKKRWKRDRANKEPRNNRKETATANENDRFPHATASAHSAMPDAAITLCEKKALLEKYRKETARRESESAKSARLVLLNRRQK